ncbi:MAG: sugar transferase [Pyrinomonadaceae bacterium]
MQEVNTAQAKRLEPILSQAQRRAPEWILPTAKALIFSIDVLLTIVCFVAAFNLREGETVLSAAAWSWSEAFFPYVGVLAFAVPIRLIMLIYQRVYRLSGAFSYTGETFKIFKAVSVGSLLIIAVTFLFRGGFAFRDFSYSRGVFVLDYVFALVAFTAFHLAVRYTQTLVRRRDINLIPTLIVGSGADAERTISELAVRRDLGYRVVGIVRNDESGMMNDELEKDNFAFRISHSAVKNVPVVGTLDNLADVIRQLAIQEVIITDSRIPSEKIFDVMMQIGRLQRVEFRFAPSLFNVLPQKTEVEQIGVLPMVKLFREPLSEAERFLKRTSDMVISGLALAILSPVWLAISILILLDSRGSILFKQERVGMDGRVFLCYKFRTMKTGADESIHREAYRKNIKGACEANIGGNGKPVFGKVKNDSRITKIGKYLRRSSLDELPQFFNVLRGNMSVVGVRPPIPYEVEEYHLKHRRRLDMKPGITGLWQVSGRNRLTFEEMVQIDLYYIENWSLWLDLKIILLTIPAIFRGDGAR